MKKKPTLRARLETDMAALVSLLVTVIALCILLTLIGAGTIAPIIVAVLWIGATLYTVIRINKLRKSMYTPNRGDGFQLFVLGAYLGWSMWIWPKIIDKVVPR